LHAFDDMQLAGAIHVRLPLAGEKLLLLNEQTVTPTADTALIADEQKALALAGIMGGEHSGINDATTDLFLESAFFSPAAIAGKARALGFSSDASYRYERGVDFELQRRAIERATQLIIDISGGQPGPVVEAACHDQLPRRVPVTLRMARATRAIGIDLGTTQIEKLVAGMGFAYARTGDVLTVTPPSYRYDIAIEEDLIEEIARLHGYDNIPAPPPKARLEMLPLPETRRRPMQVRHLVAERGYHEVVNYSFIEASWEADFSGNDTPVRLANPIASQMSVMRSSLIGGLIGTLVANLKRQTERVRVFEVGRCFLRDETKDTGYCQPLRLAALAYGPAQPEQWGQSTRAADFYDVKGDLEGLFAPRALAFERTSHPALHPGRSARVLLDGQSIGVIGEIHPRWKQKYELSEAAVVFEIDLAPLLTAPLPAYQEVSRFPNVIRDIALVVPQSCEVQALLDTLKASGPSYLREIRLFDVYQGKGIAPGCKSLAFRVVMQDTLKTLADNDADTAVACLVQKAADHYGAVLRG
jgi:phenylalanyl-tRNA synthetase beta chain